MPKTLDPFRFLLIAVAGWMNQEHRHAISYLREENRILRAHLGPRRLRFPEPPGLNAKSLWLYGWLQYRVRIHVGVEQTKTQTPENRSRVSNEIKELAVSSRIDEWLPK